MSNKQKFIANGHPTLIGSIPLLDHQEALDLILTHTPAIPLWPQLPSQAAEGMLVQFIEGIPVINNQGGKVSFNPSAANFDQDQLSFYEDYLAVSENPELLGNSRFQVSRAKAQGLYLLLDQVGSQDNIKALKGQMTGPFTQLTGLRDQNDRPGYYDQSIREMTVKGLAMKAAWQTKMLGSHGNQPILFIDEPALAGIGSSSFISVSRDDISQDLKELTDAIHNAGGLAGVHVCANTDWPLLLNSDIDIINFDAYSFFDRFIACRQDIINFLKRGGIIAWGIVPTSRQEDILNETGEKLAQRWQEQVSQLTGEDYNINGILRQSLITPSCGTGSLSPEVATRVLELTNEVSRILREKFSQ